MEHTELRDGFFAEVRRDPYLHHVTFHVANAWAMGYEQALRDTDQAVALAGQSHADRLHMAHEWLTDRQREEHARALVALAQMGQTLHEHARPPGA